MESLMSVAFSSTSCPLRVAELTVLIAGRVALPDEQPNRGLLGLLIARAMLGGGPCTRSPPGEFEFLSEKR